MPLVHAEQVSFRYPRQVHGPPPQSLTVEAGQLVLITGPSGCGKSTLARCLTGLIPHVYHGTLEGTVWLGGARTEATPLWCLAEQAGLVFQNPLSQMLAHSVENEIVIGLENLGLSQEEVTGRLEQALADFTLGDLRYRSPQTLSGGEQQRLALAAIMARRPPLLVLDEPLSMLDTRAALDLVDRLDALAARGTAIVVCEHREEYLTSLPHLRTLRLTSHEAQVPPLAPPLTNHDVPPFTVTVDDLQVALGGRTVLDSLCCGLSGGQLVALVGPNGAGKTTLLRCLAGLQPHEGRIRTNDGAPDLGLVFQNADLQLFNGTVREEICYRLAQPDEALYAWLLEALGLTAYQGTPPLLLSEGEKKRVALAVVIMRCPRHGVLLDEPSVGQDRRHKAMLLGLCRSLADTGRVVLFATHDLELASGADRLMILGNGGILADGAPAEVLCDPLPWDAVGLPVPEWVRRDLCAPVPGAEQAPARTVGGVLDSAPLVPVSQGAASKPLLVPQKRVTTREPLVAPPTVLTRARGRGRRNLSLLQTALVEDSLLRTVDPRVKIALALCASTAVMLDMPRLLFFAGLFAAFLGLAHLLPQAAGRIWRLKWVLALLFIVDWIVISPELAAIVTIRVTLLTSVFSLLFSTTVPSELSLALEWARVPYRYAFSLTLAIQSMGTLDQEWRAIREAQQARGTWKPQTHWRELSERMRDLVSLSVPAVVLVARLAWAMTEAAYARGFDSPNRRPFKVLQMRTADWALLAGAGAGAGAVSIALFGWRWLAWRARAG